MSRRMRTGDTSKSIAEAESCPGGMGRKVTGALLAVGLFCGLSGCSAAVIPQQIFDVSSSYFNNYEARSEGDLYLASGTVFQAEDDNAVIIWVKTEEAQTIPVKGELRRKDGDIKLIYEAPDKTVTVLADSSQSSQDKIEIDTELKTAEGTGLIRFEGENADFDFHVSLGGRMSGLKYLNSWELDEDLDIDSDENIDDEDSKDTENPKQDTREDAAGDADRKKEGDSASGTEEERLIDSFRGTFSADSKSQTVLKLNFREKTKVKLNADLSADQESFGNMTLGRFQLNYVSENGKTVTLLDHNETDHALGGFRWESHYSEEIIFPKGVTEIILSNISGKNFLINLNIEVYEAG